VCSFISHWLSSPETTFLLRLTEIVFGG